MKSVSTQSALDALCEKFHIPDVVHLELPGCNDRIRNSSAGKISVYSRFFDFANYRIPLSQFLVDILEYFQINLSQLSVNTAAKVSHFEILCRVHGFVPTVEMDLFAFINHVDPTKVRIWERAVAEAEVLLLQLTKDRVVPLADVNDQGNANVQGTGNDNVNEEGDDTTVADKTKHSDHFVQIRGIDIVVDDEAQAIVVDKPKKRATERFVVLSDSSHHSSTNAADDEVTSIVRSSMQPPPVLTAATATTIIADSTSALVPRTGTRPVLHSIFKDSASIGEANQDIAGPSHPARTELFTYLFFVS
ncbi:hypothetical protein Tco_1418563 [Tanacetum coccineum]